MWKSGTRFVEGRIAIRRRLGRAIEMMFAYGMLAMWLVLGAIILISDCLDSGGFWVKDIGWATGTVMFPYLVFITGPIVLLKFIRCIRKSKRNNNDKHKKNA
jgi:hypothetical protein